MTFDTLRSFVFIPAPRRFLMLSDDRPDFDAIRANAARGDVNLNEVAIIYDGLTSEELEMMRAAGLLAESGGPKVLGRFAKDGSVMFEEKATGALYLAA